MYAESIVIRMAMVVSESKDLPCTLYNVYCTVYSVHCKLYTVNCTLYIVHSTLYIVDCKLYNINYTMYIVNCTIYTLYAEHCTLYTVQCTVYIHCIFTEGPITTRTGKITSQKGYMHLQRVANQFKYETINRK